MHNEMFLIGRLTKDPIIREYTSNGTEKTTVKLFIAVNNDRYSKEELVDYFTINIYGNTTKYAAKLTKGCKVIVRGGLHLRTWESKDGTPHTEAEVLCDEITCIDWRNKKPDTETPEPELEEVNEDLPF